MCRHLFLPVRVKIVCSFIVCNSSRKHCVLEGNWSLMYYLGSSVYTENRSSSFRKSKYWRNGFRIIPGVLHGWNRTWHCVQNWSLLSATGISVTDGHCHNRLELKSSVSGLPFAWVVSEKPQVSNVLLFWCIFQFQNFTQNKNKTKKKHTEKKTTPELSLKLSWFDLDYSWRSLQNFCKNQRAKSQTHGLVQ